MVKPCILNIQRRKVWLQNKYMLDSRVRKIIDIIGKHLAKMGIKANYINMLGFVLGLISILCISVRRFTN
jgi:hypothetical protein